MVQTLKRLIDDNGLHKGELPVDLRPLDVVFVPVLMDMHRIGVPAFAIRPPSGEPTPERPALVFLDRRADRIDQRLNYAHEIAHLVARHGGSAAHWTLGEWWYGRDEREAWQGAAMLLIPRSAWEGGRTAEEVAALCEVPQWLVECYPRQCA